MSQVIEDRVVQLDFENREFERNAAQSLSTIEKLKSNLDFDSASRNLTALSNASSKFNLDGISSAVEQVGEKFSYMKYMGLVALGNLVDGAMQAGKRLVSAITSPIMSGGWTRAMNLEQANFMMKGLLKTDEAVEAVMKDVNESVDGTAYSLDAAAKVAAQFAASGLKAGENMLPALKAVAGTAAMTNSSFEEIGQIFTTVAGQGKLMTYQMRQLEFRGLNVAATLGEQLGKSEAEIRDMVTKGKIDFEMFSEAMNAAFGEHAQEANNTFQGAMSNVRSALGRIGAEFATPFIHSAIPALNAFRLAVNAVKGVMGPIFTEAASVMESISDLLVTRLSGFTTFVKKNSSTIQGIIKDVVSSLKNIFNYLSQFIAPIRDVFQTIFPPKTISYIKQISTAVLNFTKNLKMSETTGKTLWVFFGGLFSLFDSAVYVIKNLIHSLEPMKSLLQKVGDGVRVFMTTIGGALVYLNSFIKSSQSVQNVFNKIYTTVATVSAKIQEMLSSIFKGDGFGGVFANVLNGLRTVFGKLIDIVKGFIPTIKNAFGNIPEILHVIINAIKNLLTSAGTAIKNFLHSQDFKDLLSIAANGGLLYSIMNFAKGFGKKGGANLFNISGINLNLFGTVGKGLSDIGLALKENVNVKLIHEAGIALIELAGAMLILSSIDDDRLHSSIEALLALFYGLAGVITLVIKVVNNSGNAVTQAVETFKGKITSIGDAFTAAKTTLLNSFKGLLDGFTGLTQAGQFATKMGAVVMLISQLGKSILVLSIAVKILSTIDMKGIAKGLFAITVMMGEMVGAVALMSKVNFEQTANGVFKGFTKMARALFTISLAMKIIGTMDTEEVVNAVFALGLLLGEMAVIAYNMKGMDKTFRQAAGGLIAMAGAMAIIGGVLVMMTKGADFQNIYPALFALTVIITELMYFLKNFEDNKDLTEGRRLRKIATALSIMAGGVLVLAQSLSMVAQVANFENMFLAVTSLTAIVAALSKFLDYFSDKYGKSGLEAGRINVIAASLAILAGAFSIMAAAVAGLALVINKDNFGPVIAVLAVMMVALVTPLIALGKAMDSLNGVFKKQFKPSSMNVMAASLVILATAFDIMAVGVAAIAQSINKENFLTTIGIMAAMIAEMVGPLVLLGTAAAKIKGLHTTDFLIIGGALDLLAIALLGMAGAIKIVSTINFEQVWDYLAIFSITFGEMVAALALLTLEANKLGKLDMAVAALALREVGKSMLNMAEGIALIAKMPIDQVKQATIVLDSLAGILSVLMIVLAGIGSTGLGGALGVGVAAAAMLALGEAFVMIGKSASSIGTGVKMFANAMKVLASIDTGNISRLLELLQVFLDRMAKELLKWSFWLTIFSPMVKTAEGLIGALGVALIPLGFALKLISEALYYLAEGITSVVNLGGSFGLAMAEIGAGLTGLMTNLGTGLASGIKSFIVTLADSAGEIADAVHMIFGQVIPTIADAILLMIAECIRSIRVYGRDIVENLVGIFVDLLRVLADYNQPIAEAGADLLIGLMDALAVKMPELSESFINLVLQMLDDVANKILEKEADFEAAFDKLIAAIIEASSKWKEHFKEIGGDLIGGLISGFLDDTFVGKALSAAGSLAQKVIDKTREVFDSHSDSREFIDIAYDNVHGLASGTYDYSYLAEDAAGALGSNTMGSLKDSLSSGSGGITGVLDGLWSYASGLGEKVKNGTGEIADWTHQKTKNVEGSFTDLTAQVKEGSMSMYEYSQRVEPVLQRLDELYTQQNQANIAFQNGDMDLQTHNRIMETTGLEIDDLIGKVKELKEALGFLRTQQATNAKAFSDLEAKLKSGKITQGQYNAEYQKTLSAARATNKAIETLGGTVWETKEKTEEGTEANKEYAASTSGSGKAAKEAKSDIEELGESIQKTLESQMNIFDEYKKDDPMNPDQIIKNMTDQINGMTSWAANMNKIYEMGIDEGLYQKLAEMGPQGAKYVEGFANMTAEQMQRSNELFAQSVALPEVVTKGLVANMENYGKDAGTGIMQGEIDGVNEKAGELADTVGQAQTEAQTEEANVNDRHSPSRVYKKVGVDLMLGENLGILQGAPTVYATMRRVCETLINIAKTGLSREKFVTIGNQITAGMTGGIEAGAGSVLAKAASLASSVTKTIKDKLKVESPSKVMYEIGKFVDLGLANGIDHYSNRVIYSMSDVSDNVVNSMKDTIANIAQSINNEISDPVIRPVLDLSNVQAGARTLSSLFNNNQALSAQGSMNNLQNGKSIGGGITFNQYNTSPKALSRYDIYRDTRNMLSRYQQVRSRA